MALTCAAALLLTSALKAQTFTTLYNFTGGDDGGIPSASLILSGNTLFGTAAGGGSSSNGTVFKVNTDGTGFTNLYSILTWTTNAAGFTLQSATNLLSTTVWTTVSPEPVVVSGQNTVTNPISGAQHFYRLAQ